MNDTKTEALRTDDTDPAAQQAVGARALALAGFTETALVDDPTTIISGHGGIFTMPGYEG